MAEAKRDNALLEENVSRLENLLQVANEECTRSNAELLNLQSEARKRNSEETIAQAQPNFSKEVKKEAPSNEVEPKVEHGEDNRDSSGAEVPDDDNIAMLKALQSGIEARRKEKSDLRVKVAVLQLQLTEQIRKADNDAQTSAVELLKMKSEHVATSDESRQAWAAERRDLQERSQEMKHRLNELMAVEDAERQKNDNLESQDFQLQLELVQTKDRLVVEMGLNTENEAQLKATREQVEVLQAECLTSQATLREASLKLERTELSLQEERIGLDKAKEEGERSAGAQRTLEVEYQAAINAKRSLETLTTGLSTQLAQKETELMEVSLSEIEASIEADARAKQEVKTVVHLQSIRRMNRVLLVWQQGTARQWLSMLRLSFKEQCTAAVIARLGALRQEKGVGEKVAVTNLTAANEANTKLTCELTDAKKQLVKYNRWLTEATERMLAAENNLVEAGFDRRLKQQVATAEAIKLAALGSEHEAAKGKNAELTKKIAKGRKETNALLKALEDFLESDIHGRKVSIEHAQVDAIRKAKQEEETRQEKERRDAAAEKKSVDAQLQEMAERLEEASLRLRAEESAKAHTARLVDRMHSLEEELDAARFGLVKSRGEALTSRRQRKSTAVKWMTQQLNAVANGIASAYLTRWLRNTTTCLVETQRRDTGIRLVTRVLAQNFQQFTRERLAVLHFNTKDAIAAKEKQMAELQAKLKEEEKALAKAEEDEVAELSERLDALKEEARYTYFEDPDEAEKLKAEIAEVSSIHDAKVKAQLKAKMKAKQDEKQAEKQKAKLEAKIIKKKEAELKKRLDDKKKALKEKEEAQTQQAGLRQLKRIKKRLEGDPRVHAMMQMAANWRA